MVQSVTHIERCWEESQSQLNWVLELQLVSWVNKKAKSVDILQSEMLGHVILHSATIYHSMAYPLITALDCA